MTDLSGQQVVAPGSATPENASSPEQQPQENKPLTMQDVERVAEEKATRIAQSLVDKAEYRISTKAQEQIKALELNKGVLGLDDQQVQTAKQKIIMDELTATPQPGEPPSPPQPVSQAQPEGDPVAEFVSDIFKEVGTTVTPNDPEWAELQKALDANFTNPKGAIPVSRAAIKAAEAKAARIATNQEGAAARVSGHGATVTGLPADAPAKDLWAAAYKK